MLLAAILSLISSSVLLAQTDTVTTHSFTLEECIQYAYKHQTDVLNADIDQKIADAKVKETIGIGLPQISGNARFQDFLKIPTSLIPSEIFGGTPGTFTPVQFGVKYQSTTGIDVSQLLFDGSYIVGLQASKTFKELSQRAFTRTKIETNVAVRKAYYMVLVNNEQLDLLNANIMQLGDQLKQTKALNENGFAEKIDVDRLNVLYNNLITERENIKRLLALGNQMLKFQIGMPVEHTLIVEGKIADVNLTNTEEVVLDTTAYKSRIEYSLTQTQIKLNELDLKRYKSQYLPSLAAFGSGAYQFQSNNFSELYDNRFPTVVVGLQLNVPIFSGFQKANRVAQAKLELQKSNNSLFQVKNSINLEIKSSAANFRNSIASLNNQRANLNLANEILRVSKIKYEQGVGSSIEVTQAQTSLKEAENNYINALYDALVNKVNLDKASGKINE
ncbi:TolC family protein [Pedobacter sp. HX-22-1]|jgi:outer membrane protein TolC|uniref:TolC family protein n=2 Tax=Pedobacter puniceum TaxID=2666136 RepID=A0A7K0FJM2_9SPHI|nr:TolC family protein [Pedobacter puniceum]